MSSFYSLIALFLFFAAFPLSIVADRCGGNLAMVYRDPSGPTCLFSHLDPKNGFLWNASHVDELCNDRDAILSSGKYVWMINNFNGNATKFAALPIDGTNQYSQIIGMHVIIDSDGLKKLMVVTIKNILVATITPADSSININNVFIEKRSSKHDCKKRKHHQKHPSPILLSPSSFTERLSLTDFKLNADDLSAANTDSIFIISSSRIMYSINFTQSLSSSEKTMPKIDRFSIISSNNNDYPIQTIMDFQYHPLINDTNGQVIQHQFVIVDSYRLFIIHQQNNQAIANYATAIPDGPGYPRTNAVGGDLFFFSDFSHVFSIDLKNNFTISKPVNFNSYFSQGLFQYFY